MYYAHITYIVTLKDYPELPSLKILTSYINYCYVKESLAKPRYYLKKVMDIFKKDKLYLNGIDTNTKSISNKQYPILFKKDSNSDNLGGYEGSVDSNSENNNDNSNENSNSGNESVNSNSENNNNSNSANSNSNNEISDNGSSDSGYGDNQEEYNDIGLGSSLPVDEKKSTLGNVKKNRYKIGEYQAEAHYSKKGKRSLERDPSDWTDRDKSHIKRAFLARELECSSPEDKQKKIDELSRDIADQHHKEELARISLLARKAHISNNRELYPNLDIEDYEDYPEGLYDSSDLDQGTNKNADKYYDSAEDSDSNSSSSNENSPQAGASDSEDLYGASPLRSNSPAQASDSDDLYGASPPRRNSSAEGNPLSIRDDSAEGNSSSTRENSAEGNSAEGGPTRDIGDIYGASPLEDMIQPKVFLLEIG